MGWGQIEAHAAEAAQAGRFHPPAERLYLGLGYQSAGVIPHYAQVADGSLQPTHLFYRFFAEGV